MEAVGAAEDVFYEEEEEVNCYDFEPLPTLLEDEAHIYSLGATLKAAIEYIVEPETESEFGQDLHTLLEQMQEENPENRPDIESILSLCEEKLKIASSSSICRSLSAVGRRVLSIESFGASQDVCDNMWKGRMCQRSLGSKLYSNEKNNIAGDSSAVEDVTATCHKDSSVVTMVTGRESGLKEMQIDLDNEKTQHSQLTTQATKSEEEYKHAVYTDSFASVALDIKSCVIDLERDGNFKKGSLRKIKTFPKLPLELADTNNFFTSVTNSGPLARKNHLLTQESLPLDNNNEVAFSKGNLNSLAISSPPKIEPKNHQVNDLHLEAPCVCTQVSGMNLEEHMSLINGKKIGFASSDHKEDCSDATSEMPNTAGMLKGPDRSIAGAKMLDNYMALEDSSETFQGSNENSLPHCNKMASVLTTKPSVNRYGSNLIRSPELSNGAMSANNNEDNLCGGRGSEIKMVLCLDSVLLDSHGSILFAAPKAEESCDIFYLAPEIEEEDVDTEKAIREEEISSQDHAAFEFENERDEMDPSESNLGFVPITSESKLVAVKGPVPCQISLNCEKATLPVAFTSPATHFKPIILQQNANITKEVHTSVSEQFKKETRKEKHVDHNKSGYIEDSKSYGAENTDVETAPEIPECDLHVPGHSSQISSEKQKSGIALTSVTMLPSPSDSSNILQGKNILSEVPSSSLACPTSPNFLHINNIILKQDSERRVLTFVPVHLAVSEQIPNKPLRSRIAYDCYHSLPVLLSNTIASYKMSTQTENDASLCKVQNCETTNTQHNFDKSNPVNQTNCQEIECATSVGSIFTEQEHTPCTSVNQDNSYLFDIEVLPQQNGTSDALLQEVVHLIQEEFAFDGYLENGVEVFDMGNFILNLKEIKFGVFSDTICEKFCDLYWDEKLLENLYRVVNGERPSHLCITEADDSKCGNVFQDLKKSDSFLASSDQTEGEGEATFDVKAEPMINTSLAEKDFDESPSDNFKKELRLQNTIPIEKEGQCLQSNSCCIGRGFAEENTELEEDTMIKIAGNSYFVSPSLPDFHGCSPGWSSAFYGAECFDSEVHSYMKNLGKQKSNESQNIDAKKVQLTKTSSYLILNNMDVAGIIDRGTRTIANDGNKKLQKDHKVLPETIAERKKQQSANLDPSTSLTKICNRSFYILQAWIEDCYSVDFATNTDLLCTLKEFISSKVAPLNGYGAGGRPWGAEQPPPEGGPECSCPEEPGGRGGRRLRTAFSAEQLSTLESSFQRQQYLGAAERRKLAGRMRLSEVQIKTWFQNRRMKLKRQLQELRTEPFCSPPHPYGPQSGVVPLPLTYVARPPPLPRQGVASGGFTLAALPAPALDLSSACRAQPVGFWAAPCFVGYRDPKAFLLGV
ncbi:kinase non-catalytic C-lobe domain-containing protein 1 [Grus japonensis]|uniref:Kinase non-catalytic C-lobe domain-containing protein 1 n=6 Tax=Neoaves TaxID=3078114 RepID=A0ABC9X416_GRUJA